MALQLRDFGEPKFGKLHNSENKAESPRLVKLAAGSKADISCFELTFHSRIFVQVHFQ